MDLIRRYLDYVSGIRRYSPRTADIYEAVMQDFVSVVLAGEERTDDGLVAALNISELRSYQMRLLDDEKKSPKTVSQHMSVLSGFCRFSGC